ncbi:arabinan endo-1,5-alpha-L-arabinosidase [Sorangium cellulosum]|uniref:arabinan endo-1,5-alpha-L-arabinosidase n=1 Tax=Sorangium cellulosum TaxID=56 RepID=UPI0011DCF85E|nr:arabinan endo-1,5-alpha-L-arabinosidase [Sorangium cellulosum]
MFAESAGRSTGRRSYRIDATGINTRLLANDPPGWTAKELVDEFVARPARVVGFDFPFCVAAGIKLDVDLRLVALACRCSSGTAKTPDDDVADALVALCTSILHAEDGCRPVLAPDPTWQERLVKEWEGAIWAPTITTSAPA